MDEIINEQTETIHDVDEKWTKLHDAVIIPMRARHTRHPKHKNRNWFDENTETHGPDNNILYIESVQGDTKHNIAGPLLRIFQLSLHTGEVSTAWHRANYVAPISKKENRTEPRWQL